MTATSSAGALGLHTDLYELRMVESYLRLGMLEPATFSLFVRPSPARPWIVAAGFDLVLDVLDGFRYGAAELDYLRAQGFSPHALEWLGNMRPQGELWAVDEGRVLLGNEPLLELTAPLPVAQLLETALMNAVHYDTLVATQAARCALAARGRPIIDFGFRRAHGLESGVRASRAAYVGGAAATSNVEAGRRFGVPIAGTMAHSFIQAFDHERDAFREFVKDHPDGTTLLVDTYAPLVGVERAIDVVRELEPSGARVRALRIDCEPLLPLAKRARALLDAANLRHIELFVSGGLSAERIAALIASGAPIDAFGIGSALVASPDAPALDIAYKLVEYAGVARAKYSEHKVTLPGRKQVFRNGSPAADVIHRREARGAGIPLLRPIWRDGQRLCADDVPAARERAQADLATLPSAWRESPSVDAPPVPRIGGDLEALAAEVRARVFG